MLQGRCCRIAFSEGMVERVRQAGFTVDRMKEGEIPSQGYQSAGGRVTSNIILALAVLLLNIDH